MFGLFGSTKFILIGLAAVAIVAVVTGGYVWINNLIEENAILKTNNAVLEDVVDAKNEEIKQRESDLRRNKAALETLDQANEQSEKRISQLLQLLGDGRLGRAAQAKPKLIEKKVNEANKKWLEEMRELTR